MAGSRRQELSPNKRVRTKRGPKNSKPLFCSPNPAGQVQHPRLTKIPRHLACRVPRSRLPLVEARVAVRFKLALILDQPPVLQTDYFSLGGLPAPIVYWTAPRIRRHSWEAGPV